MTGISVHGLCAVLRSKLETRSDDRASFDNATTSPSEAGVARMSGPILKSAAYEAPASEPAEPGEPYIRTSTQNQPVAQANQAQEAIIYVAINIDHDRHHNTCSPTFSSACATSSAR